MSLHATTVAVDGRALAIAGPSGAGKSSVAAQMIALGAGLVCDDLTVVSQEDGRITAAMPPHGAPAIALRGLGIVPMAVIGPTRLVGIVWLQRGTGALPNPETLTIRDVDVSLLRQPADSHLAAKLILWLRAHAIS